MASHQPPLCKSWRCSQWDAALQRGQCLRPPRRPCSHPLVAPSVGYNLRCLQPPTIPKQVLNRLGNQTANEWLGDQTARTAPTDVLKRIAGPRLLWQVGAPCPGVLRRSVLRCAVALLTVLQSGAISTPETSLLLATNQTVCLCRSWA